MTVQAPLFSFVFTKKTFDECACCCSCVVAVAMRAWSWTARLPARAHGYTLVSPAPPPSSPVAALAKLGMIMAYFYLCDRTNFFMKENKYYSEWSFWLPVGYVFALGLFFTEDSRSSK